MSGHLSILHTPIEWVRYIHTREGQMQMYTEKQMRRKNFFLSPDLDDRAAAVAKHLDLDFSELVRAALDEFVQRREREHEEEELAKACENYREFNKRFSPGWAKFETRIK